MTEPRDPDPYKMYTVVRRSLKLTAGKVGSQCQHAMDYLDREVERLRSPPMAVTRTKEDAKHLTEFVEWRTSKDHAKVILGANDDEFLLLKNEYPQHFLVIDLGYTEVEPNTETCFALWPMRMSARSKLLSKLRPL